MGGRTIRWLVPLLAVLAAGVGVAAAGSSRAASGTVGTAHNAKYGTILVGANGMTLYRYVPDRKGVSVCKGSCTTYWPALTMKGNAKPTVGPGAQSSLLGTIQRGNGVRQVTYAGYPLYRYVGDSKAGQVSGEGVKGTWYAVDASGGLVKHAAAKTTTKSSGGGWG